MHFRVNFVSQLYLISCRLNFVARCLRRSIILWHTLKITRIIYHPMVIIDLNLIKFQYYANTMKTMEIIATSKSNFKSKQLYHNVLQ